MNAESAAAGATDAVSCPSCHATLARGMRFCRMCGYRLGEGVEEYAQTRLFSDGKVPVADAPPKSAGAAAGAPFQTPNAWGAVAPIQPLSPAQAEGSTFSKIARKLNPLRMGWVFWIILSIAIITVGAAALRTARDRNAPPPPPQSYLEVDGFETADGGGAFIEGLEAPDTSLERAGIFGGDIITKWDGKLIEDADDIRRALRETPPGKSVEVEFISNGESKKTTVTTIDRRGFQGLSGIEGRPGGRGQIGIDVGSRVRIPGSPNNYGTRVSDVRRNGPADLAGLKDGDIIAEFGGKPTRTPGDLRLRIYEAAPGSTVTAVVYRGAERIEIQIKVGRSRD